MKQLRGLQANGRGGELCAPYTANRDVLGCIFVFWHGTVSRMWSFDRVCGLVVLAGCFSCWLSFGLVENNDPEKEGRTRRGGFLTHNRLHLGYLSISAVMHSSHEIGIYIASMFYVQCSIYIYQ